MVAKLLAIDGGWGVEGDINYKTVVALRKEGDRCLAQSNPSCCFDFSRVNQVNTAALSLLLCWHRKAKELGVELNFADLPSELIAIAKMSDLSSLIE